MSRRVNQPRALIALGLLCLQAAAYPQAPAGTAARGSEPRISLRKGLDIQQVVRTLGEALPGVVAADAPPVGPPTPDQERLERGAPRRTLQREIGEAPLSEALGRVSQDLDVYWTVRGRAISLQWRFGTPEVSPGLEVEELQDAARQAFSLLRPFTPRLLDVGDTEEHNQFLASLTQDEIQALTHGGVPLRALPAAQRNAWLRINAGKAFAEVAHTCRAAAVALSAWPRVRLVDETPPGASLQALFLSYADAQGFDGRSTIDMGWPQINRRPRAAVAEGERLKEEPAPAGLRAPRALSARKMELRSLIDSLAQSGTTVKYPSYAAKRSFLICSNTGATGDVLRALCDLWGWELTRTEGGFRIGRPRLSRAADPLDLHSKMLRCFPPALAHMIRAVLRDDATEPLGLQMDEVFLAVRRELPGAGRSIDVARLDPTTQRRLANVVAAKAMASWYREFGRVSRPPNWVLHPEMGTLTLSGPLGPGLHPLMWFHVPDEKGHSSGWGWAVNTSRHVK